MKTEIWFSKNSKAKLSNFSRKMFQPKYKADHAFNVVCLKLGNFIVTKIGDYLDAQTKVGSRLCIEEYAYEHMSGLVAQ